MQKVLAHNDTLALEILSRISEGIIITDCARCVTFINTAAISILGCDRDVIGIDIQDIYPITNELDQPLILFSLDKIQEHGNAISGAVLLKNKANKELIINQKIELYTKENQEIGYSIIFTSKNYLNHRSVIETTNLTVETFASHHAVAADNRRFFSNSQQFYKIAENSPDVIYIIDVRKRSVVYFNRSELFGYDSNQLESSDGWINIVHPEDINRVRAHWNKFIKTATESESIEYRIKKKNETYEWVLNRHSILERAENSEPKLILLNITIITDSKVLEQSLRNTETSLLELIEHTQDLIWSVNVDYNFTAMNSAFKNLFKNNYKSIVNVGDNLLDSLPEKINIEWLQLHRRALYGEQFTTELKIFKKKCEYTFELELNPIQNEQKEITGVCVFARNISQRKKAENEIVRTNFELDSFVYRTSHDLRAPLRSILGLLSIIKSEDNHEQRSTYLLLVDKSINKLDSFISDLTNFSRNSRLEIKIEKINFQEIIDECLENLQYMDYAHEVSVSTNIEGENDFYSDSVRIAIVFQNLLSNAIKYCNPRVEKSWIKIKILIEGNSCNIALEDNGMGIRDQYLNQIFNMFFRASNDSYGSGLGLYITKQVVEKLHGVISVSSSVGIGTVFNIKLPIKKKYLNNSKSTS